MSDISKQLRLLPEGCDETGATLHRAQTRAGVRTQMRQVSGAEVEHGVRFEVAPDTLDWIQIGRVRRQILERNLAALLLGVVAHESGTVSLQAIPDDQELATDRRLQCFEELNDLGTLDSPWKEPKVKPPEAQPRSVRPSHPACPRRQRPRKPKVARRTR